MTQQPMEACLMGGSGGPPAIKDGPHHRPQGAWIGGIILDKGQKQEQEVVRDRTTGKLSPGDLKFFPSGDPIYGMWIDVKLDPQCHNLQAESFDDADDFHRRIYIEGKRKKEAAGRSLATAGMRQIPVGGKVFYRWTGTEDSGGMNPATVWEFVFRPAPPPEATTLVPGGVQGEFPVAPQAQAPQFPAAPQAQAPQFPAAPQAQAPQFPAAPQAQAPQFPAAPQAQAPQFPAAPQAQAPQFPAAPQAQAPQFPAAPQAQAPQFPAAPQAQAPQFPAAPAGGSEELPF